MTAVLDGVGVRQTRDELSPRLVHSKCSIKAAAVFVLVFRGTALGFCGGVLSLGCAPSGKPDPLHRGSQHTGGDLEEASAAVA